MYYEILRERVKHLKEMINEKIRCKSLDIRYNVEIRSFLLDIKFSFIDIGIRLDEEMINRMSLEDLFNEVVNLIEKECRKLYLKE